jgi:hypothetical protein
LADLPLFRRVLWPRFAAAPTVADQLGEGGAASPGRVPAALAAVRRAVSNSHFG